MASDVELLRFSDMIRYNGLNLYYTVLKCICQFPPNENFKSLSMQSACGHFYLSSMCMWDSNQ